jgi:phosphopantothenoylcysteine decarboxylase/phosphopantothenate--cysteine ligase
MIAPRILLVVGGGIAAYKSCELVRLIRKGGGSVTCVLTEGGAQFVTPLALAALSENAVHTTLWDLKNEVEMGHIQLSRQSDLVVVCPATADLMAKMAAGIADDLATTLLLATDKPVMAVPAMNVRMWQHAATVRNVATLRGSGVHVMDPDEGAMACGEFGPGRLPEPEAVWQAIRVLLGLAPAEDVTGEADADGEPEPETEEGGLPSLSASLIARGKKQPIVFGDVPAAEPSWDDAAWNGAGWEEGAAFEEPAFVQALAPGQASPLDLSGPLLSKKGKARGAPPTDPEAINHLVSGAQLPPEPFGDGAPVDLPANPLPLDPLAGQPDFEVQPRHRPLFGRHVLVTAGPTHEPIDPVRYIANRSSGKQGFAIAAAAAELGARVTLVAGPVNLPTPPGVDRIDVETAREMAAAVKASLPADAAVMVAAVADWRTSNVAEEKIKKRGSAPPVLMLTENPDVLGMVSGSPQRPRLLIGFAAETENVLANAAEKRKRKATDWIVANDVSGDVMGGAANTVHIVTSAGVESLPEMPKEDVARALVERMADALA